MNQRGLLIIGVAGLIGLAIVAQMRSTPSTTEEAMSDAPQYQYAMYPGKSPHIDFSMEVPEGWSIAESTGSRGSYHEVQFLGPRDEERQFSPSLSVTVRPVTPDSAYADADAWAEAILRQKVETGNAELLQQGNRALDEATGSLMIVEYTLQWPPYSADAVATPIREYVITAQHNERLYQLVYLNVAEDFSTWLKAADHGANSLHFL